MTADADSIVNTPLKILIVDDDPDGRLLLKRFLRDSGYEILTAENGREAVEKYPQLLPDIILMDIMMPEMNGYDATKAIKAQVGERFVPVIFLTAMTDDKSLAKCVEYGGDDFLTKPYSKVILRAKISALKRMRDLYGTLQHQRDELRAHEGRMRREQELAERVFTNIAQRARIRAHNIKYTSEPAAISNGDLLLATDRANGNQYILLGDFTGHGLSAALGALPVSDLFYQLTDAGADLPAIVRVINGRLRETLPVSMFFAVCLLEFSPRRMELKVWNGGVPDLLLRRVGGDVERLGSDNFPLGVVGNDDLDTTVKTLHVAEGDRVYLYSDGVIEADGPEGAMFGEERLDEILRGGEPDLIFDGILAALEAFRAGHDQRDDITLLELTCQAEGALG